MREAFDYEGPLMQLRLKRLRENKKRRETKKSLKVRAASPRKKPSVAPTKEQEATLGAPGDDEDDLNMMDACSILGNRARRERFVKADKDCRTKKHAFD